MGAQLHENNQYNNSTINIGNNFQKYWEFFFTVLWPCLGMPDHTQQKLCDHTVASMAV